MNTMLLSQIKEIGVVLGFAYITKLILDKTDTGGDGFLMAITYY